MVERVSSAGAVAKIALKSQQVGPELNVEISSQRFAELGLQRGEWVYVSPRKVRLFMPEYVI